MDRGATTVSVVMTIRDAQLVGSVTREGGAPCPYVGWLGLISALQDAATQLPGEPQHASTEEIGQ
jgi:hypothetical protein